MASCITRSQKAQRVRSAQLLNKEEYISYQIAKTKGMTRPAAKATWSIRFSSQDEQDPLRGRSMRSSPRSSPDAKGTRDKRKESPPAATQPQQDRQPRSESKLSKFFTERQAMVDMVTKVLEDTDGGT